MLHRIALISLLLLSQTTFCQDARDIMIGIQSDLVKTDQTRLFQKAQFGAEVNYFAARTLAITSGLEVWTANEFSLLIGMRWYPADNTFIRLRGLVGANDLALGAGWSKPLNERFRFEAIGDFYFDIDFSIRAGIAYVIPKN